MSSQANIYSFDNARSRRNSSREFSQAQYQSSRTRPNAPFVRASNVPDLPSISSNRNRGFNEPLREDYRRNNTRFDNLANSSRNNGSSQRITNNSVASRQVGRADSSRSQAVYNKPNRKDMPQFRPQSLFYADDIYETRSSFNSNAFSDSSRGRLNTGNNSSRIQRKSSHRKALVDALSAENAEEYDKEIEEENIEEQENRMSWFARKKKERTKAKAEAMFAKQHHDDKSSSADSGPRAAVYRGQASPQARRTAHMERASEASRSRKNTQQSSSKIAGALGLLSGHGKIIATTTICMVLTLGILYPPAQQYYQSIREQDRLLVEYDVLSQRNSELESSNAHLQSDAGVASEAHDRYGWVVKGEEAGRVEGLPEDIAQSNPNSIDSSAAYTEDIEAPTHWYSPALDFIFNVD